MSLVPPGLHTWFVPATTAGTPPVILDLTPLFGIKPKITKRLG